MLNIIVCVKQVSDPEAPVSSYSVDSETNRIVQKGVPPVISPFDENALEAALRIKDAHEAKIIVISVGRNLSRAVLSRSLAAGADQLVLIDDNVFDNLDSTTVAQILAIAIKKIGKAIMDGLGVKGYSVFLDNKSAANQHVPHAHFHLVPRAEGDGLERWPQSGYGDGEAEFCLKKIKEKL